MNLSESEGFGDQGPAEFEKLLEVTKPDVVIECIPQNIRSGEPSLHMLRAALDAGCHVITANKSAVALGYRDLLHRAAKANVTLRFEPTVLDGLPVFSTVAALPGIEIKRVRGIFNGTSSLVLESVESGATRARGLARAQAQGIAEADTVLDLDGWDAAAKAALIANVWMGGALRVVDVARSGCETVKDETLRGSGPYVRHRLVAEIVRYPGGVVRAAVEPIALEPDDPLFSLKGACCGLTIETSKGFAMSFLQTSHGLDDASFGIMQDVVAISRGAPQI